MSKKKDIRKQLMLKYMTLIIIFSMTCLGIGVTLAEKMLLENSAILLSNFAKETGKNIANIIDLEIQNVEMLANTPVLQDKDADEDRKDEIGTNMINRDIDKVINCVNSIEDAKTNLEYKELGAITEKMIAGEGVTGS